MGIDGVVFNLPDRPANATVFGQPSGGDHGEGLDPDRLSFTGCFQILQCRLPECRATSAASLQKWAAALLWEMNGERLELRRNRINPRVIKQKMSQWKKKRTEHCLPPPLQKTFAESVVMAN